MAPRKKQSSSVAAPLREQKLQPTDNPLVFISHDSRDADLAEAFANLLTDASGGILKSFRSSDRKGTAGIEYGQEWYQAIMQKLDTATDVVALLTTRSINRPWILYETGVAKGKLAINDRVFGIALGITLDEAATGPFAQFQNSPDEEDAITGLVLQLIRRHPQAAPREEAVRRQVKAFRESVTALLKDRKSEKAQSLTKTDETSVAKFFEEMKLLIGDVPGRVAGELNSDSRIRKIRRRRRFHPGMLERLVQHPIWGESPELASVPVLIAFSMVRDDFPWLFELGTNLFRALDSRDDRRIDRSYQALMQTLDMMAHTPFLFELMDGIEDEGSVMFLRHFLHEFQEFRPRLKRLSKADNVASDKKS